MIYYFNSQNGLPATPNVDAGESLVKQGLAIKKEDVPADVETWRLSVNVETGALTVFAEGKQEADALIDKKTADSFHSSRIITLAIALFFSSLSETSIL